MGRRQAARADAHERDASCGGLALDGAHAHAQALSGL